MKSFISRFVAAATISMGAVFTAQAGVVTIDFSDYAAGTTPNTYGVNFSLDGGPDSGGAPIIGDIGDQLVNSHHVGYFPTANILRAVFQGVASDVSFVFDNHGCNGSSVFTATDINGDVLQTGSLDCASNTSFTLTADNIYQLDFNNGMLQNESWWFGLTAITFNLADDMEIPEPGSLALVGLSLLGLAAVRRRRH
jgi:PEP-CTERM motif